MPTVALASEFLDAFARLPRVQQKKVREFTEKFKADPRSPAINYEKIHQVKDDKVRTVRIGLHYRAVVLHPEQDDVYVLMWVDNHDEAMEWAAKRTFEVNPRTGALQIISVGEVQQAAQPDSGQEKGPGLLAQHDDDTLLSFGIPAVLLPAVRAIQQPEELLLLAKHLPAEAAESLVWLAEGLPVEEVRTAVASKPKTETIDVADLASALSHPDSRRRFVTIQTDHDLTSILDAPLEKWRVFLHPSQERLVAKGFTGPARVTGGAGTGKTVVAMHRARHLAQTVCTKPGDRVLLTTYTANLAQNIDANLATLCGVEKDQIEVVHLHAWAIRFMKDQGVVFEMSSPEDLDQCWEQALLGAEEPGFDLGFLRQEWEQVVLANNIEQEADYLKVPRIGRGRTLSRLLRARIWNVFERFQQSLRSRGKQEWGSVIRKTRLHLEQKKPKLPYRAVVVDEAQDFHAEAWRLIRALVPHGPNDLFIVGDAHQRIYGQKVALKNCGINVLGRSSKLQINYRTTEQIRAWAMTMLRGIEIDDLDGAKDDEQGYKSLLAGPQPEVCHFASKKAETEYLCGKLKELLKDHAPEEICLAARTNKMLRDDYQPMLKGLGLDHTLLERGREGQGIRLATMHRIKGLEFPVMILAGINAKSMPLRVPSSQDDSVSREEHEERERSLLFVAATRARDRLVVTGWGSPSPFMPSVGP